MSERRSIGRKDRTGREVRVGDAFEYGDDVYIIAENKQGEIIVRDFENQVEYGVEQPPYYVERDHIDPDELEFEQDKITGSIEDNEAIRELYNREVNIPPEGGEY